MMPWWKELQKGELRSIEEAARSGGVKVEDEREADLCFSAKDRRRR